MHTVGLCSFVKCRCGRADSGPHASMASPRSSPYKESQHPRSSLCLLGSMSMKALCLSQRVLVVFMKSAVHFLTLSNFSKAESGSLGCGQPSLLCCLCFLLLGCNVWLWVLALGSCLGRGGGVSRVRMSPLAGGVVVCAQDRQADPFCLTGFLSRLISPNYAQAYLMSLLLQLSV